jgi:acyl carrier protein
MGASGSRASRVLNLAIGFPTKWKRSESAHMPDQVTEAIRGVLSEYGRLSVDVARLDELSDLYEAGMTSLASVNLMLALEEHFAVEFPERMLRRGGFASIAVIRSNLQELLGAES